MHVADVLTQARDTMTVKRVFGEPYEQDGATIIPVASIAGGAGGGGGSDQAGDEGSGAGFGLVAKPAGVYVIREGEVTWQPALDLNRVILVGQIVGIVAILALRSVLKAFAASRRRDDG